GGWRGGEGWGRCDRFCGCRRGRGGSGSSTRCHRHRPPPRRRAPKGPAHAGGGACKGQQSRPQRPLRQRRSVVSSYGVSSQGSVCGPMLGVCPEYSNNITLIAQFLGVCRWLSSSIHRGWRHWETLLVARSWLANDAV